LHNPQAYPPDVNIWASAKKYDGKTQQKRHRYGVFFLMATIFVVLAL
jgi:hypothetical protein